MQTRTKVIITTLCFGTLAFLANGQTPIGQIIWPPDAHAPAPVGIEIPLLVGATAVEAVLFGLGVSFLAWGWPLVKRLGAPRGISILAFVAIAWTLISWFPHDNLHAHYGESMRAIALLSWGFHVTLGVSGALLAAFLHAASRAARPARASQKAAPDALPTP
jgi:hypothetical protein